MSKLIGNQEFDGDVYVKGVGGYDGTNAGTSGIKKVAEVINDNPWERGSDNGAQMSGTVASGEHSIAGGPNNANGIVAAAPGAFAFGDNEAGAISASGYGSQAMGYNDQSDGDIGIEASADGAHAEGCVDGGDGIFASGKGSHAEGYCDGDTIEASGDGAHAEGSSTKASGNYSHAEGSCSTSEGIASHAEGYYTQTTNPYEHAEGKYNKSNNNPNLPSWQTIHSVGIGTALNDRKNAFEILRNGNIYMRGVGGYDGTNGGTSENVIPVTSVITQAANDAHYAVNNLFDSFDIDAGDYADYGELDDYTQVWGYVKDGNYDYNSVYDYLNFGTIVKAGDRTQYTRVFASNSEIRAIIDEIGVYFTRTYEYLIDISEGGSNVEYLPTSDSVDHPNMSLFLNQFYKFNSTEDIIRCNAIVGFTYNNLNGEEVTIFVRKVYI